MRRELSATLRVLMETGKAVGLNVGIFNPALDPDGTIARRFVECLVGGLMSSRAQRGSSRVVSDDC